MTHAHTLALEILAGQHDRSGPWVSTRYFTVAQWRKAAQWVIDAEDYDDLLHMIAVEEAAERYDEGLAA